MPAPDDGWRKGLQSLQIAQWANGSHCEQCKKPYTNEADWRARDPRVGHRAPGGPLTMVDAECWPAYEHHLRQEGLL